MGAVQGNCRGISYAVTQSRFSAGLLLKVPLNPNQPTNQPALTTPVNVQSSALGVAKPLQCAASIDHTVAMYSE